MEFVSLKQICEETENRPHSPLVSKAVETFEMLNKKIKFSFLERIFTIEKTLDMHEYFQIDGTWVYESQGMSYFLPCDSIGSIYNIFLQKEEIQKKEKKTLDDFGILARYNLFEQSIEKIKKIT